MRKKEITIQHKSGTNQHWCNGYLVVFFFFKVIVDSSFSNILESKNHQFLVFERNKIRIKYALVLVLSNPSKSHWLSCKKWQTIGGLGEVIWFFQKVWEPWLYIKNQVFCFFFFPRTVVMHLKNCLQGAVLRGFLIPTHPPQWYYPSTCIYLLWNFGNSIVSSFIHKWVFTSLQWFIMLDQVKHSKKFPNRTQVITHNLHVWSTLMCHWSIIITPHYRQRVMSGNRLKATLVTTYNITTFQLDYMWLTSSLLWVR